MGHGWTVRVLAEPDVVELLIVRAEKQAPPVQIPLYILGTVEGATQLFRLIVPVCALAICSIHHILRLGRVEQMI